MTFEMQETFFVLKITFNLIRNNNFERLNRNSNLNTLYVNLWICKTIFSTAKQIESILKTVSFAHREISSQLLVIWSNKKVKIVLIKPYITSETHLRIRNNFHAAFGMYCRLRFQQHTSHTKRNQLFEALANTFVLFIFQWNEKKNFSFLLLNIHMA